MKICNRKSFVSVSNVFNMHPEIVDMEVTHADFTPSQTDQSYYVPNSEINKNLSKLGASMQGVYDNGSVDDLVVSLRRPGLDKIEMERMAKAIVEDCQNEAKANSSKRAELEKARADAKTKADSQSAFVDNLMAGSDSSTQK